MEFSEAISNPKRWCTQYSCKFGKVSSGHRTRKGQFSFQSQRKASPMNVQTTTQLHSSYMLAKQCSKFFKSCFNSTWTEDFQMFTLDLEKAKEPEIKLPKSARSLKKQESSRKKKYLFLLNWQAKAFDSVDHCVKFLKLWGYQATWPASWEICMQVKKQQLVPNMEQWTGSKFGKEFIKAVYCHPAYLTAVQSTSWEMLGWMKHKLESRLPGEISVTSDMQMTWPLWQKAKRN